MSNEQTEQSPVFSRGCAHTMWAKVKPDTRCKKMAWLFGGCATALGGGILLAATMPPSPVVATISALLMFSGLVEIGVGLAGKYPGMEAEPLMQPGLNP